MERSDLEAPIEIESVRGLSPRALLLIAAMAALPRLAGLGHVSLWLDEILGTLQTSGSLAQTWQALKIDRVHPPLWGLVDWLTQQATGSEPLRRLVPIVFGIATVLLLADLVARRFGPTTAKFAATIAGFSPLHVRYSQELRPYSLGLMMLVLALWLVVRAVDRDRASDWVLVGFSIWAGIGSLYLLALVLLPALLLVLCSGKPRAGRRRDLMRFTVAVTGALGALAPWFGTLGEALAKVHELPATKWTLELTARRWHFLTAAANDGDAANAGSLVLALIALVGAWSAARTNPGRVVLVGFACGSMGMELLLVLDNHWSNGRYSIAAWPFLVVILAVGCREISTFAASGTRPNGPVGALLVPLGSLLAVFTIVGAEGLGLLSYYDHGRRDWLGVARDASRISRPGQTIWVANEWTRISLGYYVASLEDGIRPGLSTRVRVAGTPAEFAATDTCGALVVAWYPERPELDDLFGASPAQKRFPRTEARLLALPVGSNRSSEDPWHCLPQELEVQAGERLPRFWGIPLRRGSLAPRLELLEEDADQLLFGWSFAERNREGISFRWTVGHWAAVRLPAVGGRLLMRVWAFEDGQRLTVYRHRLPVSDFPLQRQQQEIGLDWPSAAAVGDGEVVYLHFAQAAPPDRVDRPLAAGFDRIEIVESAPPDLLR